MGSLAKAAPAQCTSRRPVLLWWNTGLLALGLLLPTTWAWALAEPSIHAASGPATAPSPRQGPVPSPRVPARSPASPPAPARPAPSLPAALPVPVPVPERTPTPSATPPATPPSPEPLPSPPPAPACPSAAPSPGPLFRVTGYELRQERIADPDWQRMLGRGRYRQYQASRWLVILGGATAFAGAVSLLVGLGNLAGQTDFGRRVADTRQPDFEAFVAGFGAMTGVGGAALLTGAILSWSLPDRVRPLYVPHVEKVEEAVPAPTNPPAKAPLSAFPNWAFVAPLGPARAWIQ